MQNAPVAADPASQPKRCQSCQQILQDFVAQHVCQGCGAPQPVSSQDDFFSAFGMPRAFGLDRKELELRYYRISRALHPDRFTTQGPEFQRYSMDRMSFLNEAYETLRSPELLREYVLKLEGVSAAKRVIPTEVAERWFEIQDLLSEADPAAQTVLADFETELARKRQVMEQAFSQLESEYDLSHSKQSLEALAQEIQKKSYLESLSKDVERTKSHARTN